MVVPWIDWTLTMGEIKSGKVRFHVIIQVDISIRSFDQNALSVYFLCKQ